MHGRPADAGDSGDHAVRRRRVGGKIEGGRQCGSLGLQFAGGPRLQDEVRVSGKSGTTVQASTDLMVEREIGSTMNARQKRLGAVGEARPLSAHEECRCDSVSRQSVPHSFASMRVIGIRSGSGHGRPSITAQNVASAPSSSRQ